MDMRPIGVFDSGIGGLTAVKALRTLLPGEDLIYFGDTARMPYGQRDRETLIDYSRQDVRFLRRFDVKAVLIACGTATTAALDTLRQELDLPIMGVVEAACRRAAAVTASGSVGMIATRASVRTGVYEETMKRLAPEAALKSIACPELVTLAEQGRFRLPDRTLEETAAGYLSQLRDREIDTLILGCTHFSLLREALGTLMGPTVTLVDASAEAAAAFRALLGERALLAERTQGTARFYVSGSPDTFRQSASTFLGEDLRDGPERIDIEQY